jgi:hypothetical protein
MPYSAELLPEDKLKELFEDNWVNYQEIHTPEFLVTNDPDNAIAKMDLTEGDKVVIYGEGESVKYRGNVTYIDRIYTLGVSIYTTESRQRLRDIYRSIRAILLIKKHSFPGWQFIRLINYQEMVLENLNIWRGELKLQIENHAVLAETAI